MLGYQLQAKVDGDRRPAQCAKSTKKVVVCVSNGMMQTPWSLWTSNHLLLLQVHSKGSGTCRTRPSRSSQSILPLVREQSPATSSGLAYKLRREAHGGNYSGEFSLDALLAAP